MNERQRYIKILNQLSSSGYNNLSKEDRDFFFKYSLDFDEGKLKGLQQEMAKLPPGERLAPDKLNALLDEGFKSLTLPENKDLILQQAKEFDKKETSGKLREGLGAILAGSDLLTANAQIRQYKEGLSKSKRPSRPPVLQRDPYLAQVKQNAASQNYSTPVAIQAAKTGINDAYLGDLQNARVASAGQPGAFGAYAQSAVNRRGRRALELAPMANQIQQQQNERMDRLAGMSASENQAINDSASRYYPTDMEQYRFEQGALANIGQAGYLNRRDSLYNLGRVIPDLASRQIADRRYRDMYNKLYASGVDSNIANQAVDSHRRINDVYYDNELPTYNKTY